MSKSNLLPILILLNFLFFSCGSDDKTDSTPGNTGYTVTNTLSSDTVKERKTIVFFGNSLTAGLGLNKEEAFPALLQNRIDSLGLNYQVVNAGVSGETTASGKNRVDWVLNQPMDVFVLELGANDGLRGLPLEETRKNLEEIIDKVREKNPDATIILAGMQLPPNMGREYASKFRKIFPEIAKEKNVRLIPFLLEGVAGEPELNLEDGVHPNAAGQKIVAENVWQELEHVLESKT